MALSKAHIGSGTTLHWDPAGETAVPTFSAATLIAEVTNATINQTTNTADVTALDQSSVSQHLGGSRGATITVAGNFLPDDHNITAGPKLYGIFQARTICPFQFTFNDVTDDGAQPPAGTASTLKGTGFITELSPNVGGHDEPLSFSMTIRVTPTTLYANGLSWTFAD